MSPLRATSAPGKGVLLSSQALFFSCPCKAPLSTARDSPLCSTLGQASQAVLPFFHPPQSVPAEGPPEQSGMGAQPQPLSTGDRASYGREPPARLPAPCTREQTCWSSLGSALVPLHAAWPAPPGSKAPSHPAALQRPQFQHCLRTGWPWIPVLQHSALRIQTHPQLVPSMCEDLSFKEGRKRGKKERKGEKKRTKSTASKSVGGCAQVP